MGVHHWDVLESISGVLDPYRGHFSRRVQQVAIALTVVLTPEPTLYDRRFQSYSRFRGIIFPRLPQSRRRVVNRSPKNDSGSISRLLAVRSARYRSINDQNQKKKNQISVISKICLYVRLG